MKTYHLKDLLKRELLIIELPNVETEMSIGLHCIGIKPPPIGKDASDTNGYYHIYKEMFHGYTILGKPDEIREDDAKELVESWESVAKDGTVVYENYSGDRIPKKRTATESLLSAIESVIFWDVNPVPKLSDHQYFLPSLGESFKLKKKFDEAELRTFEKSRTLIFVKN